MTTVELANRIIGKSTVASLDGAEMDELLCISDAINEAVQEYFSVVPEVYRTTTMSSTHSVPTALTATFTNGSNVVTGSPFTDGQRGDTISIEGDALDFNEITDNGLLLNDYRGTTGSHSSTIYDDAVALTDFSIERLVSDPKILDTSKLLTNAKQHWRRDGERHLRIGNEREISDYPLYYWLDNVGGSAVTDALSIIRLDPIPKKAFTLNIEILIRPIAYTWENMVNTPLTLPVDDTLIHRTIRPMALGKLAATDLWDGSKGSAANAMAIGNKAIEGAAGLPSEIEKPNRKIYPRRNF